MIMPMREADSVLLEALRKSVAADVDPAVWESVEKQAAEVGVLGLTGTARALVEGLVRKHGSHNQQSHNPHRSGGSSGQGGGSGKDGKSKSDGVDATIVSGSSVPTAYKDKKSGKRIEATRTVEEIGGSKVRVTDTLSDGSTRTFESAVANVSRDRKVAESNGITYEPVGGAVKGKGLVSRDQGMTTNEGVTSSHARTMSQNPGSTVTASNGYRGKIKGAKHVADLQPGDRFMILAGNEGKPQVAEFVSGPTPGKSRATVSIVGSTGKAGIGRNYRDWSWQSDVGDIVTIVE